MLGWSMAEASLAERKTTNLTRNSYEALSSKNDCKIFKGTLFVTFRARGGFWYELITLFH